MILVQGLQVKEIRYNAQTSIAVVIIKLVQKEREARERDGLSG